MLRYLFFLFLFCSPLLAELALSKSGNCDPPVPPFPIAYGELYTVGTQTQAGITGVPVQLVTFTTNGLASGTTPNATMDLIAINTTGVYEVSLDLSIEGAGGRDWTFQVAVNGVALPNLTFFMGTEGTSTDSRAGGISGLASLVSGDLLTVLVSVTGAATTLTVEASNLHLIRIE